MHFPPCVEWLPFHAAVALRSTEQHIGPLCPDIQVSSYCFTLQLLLEGECRLHLEDKSKGKRSGFTMLPCMAHHKFKASLGYMVSFKADRAAQQNCLKTQKQNEIKGEMVESPFPYMFPRRIIMQQGLWSFREQGWLLLVTHLPSGPQLQISSRKKNDRQGYWQTLPTPCINSLL